MDDDATTNETESAPTTVTNSVEEVLNEDNIEEVSMYLLKSRVKHLFILSSNGKPVFTR